MPERGLLKISGVQRETGDGVQTLSATFTTPQKQLEIWFRTDAGTINALAEPFLPIALIPAMRRGWAIHIDEAISPALYEGANNIQQVMCSWYKNFSRVPIEAKRALDGDVKQSRQVAAFFSGGVDSFFSLKQHSQEVTHLIFVHGFDLSLDEEDRRRTMAQNSRRVAEQRQLQFVEVETNLRDFGDGLVSWPYAYFGAGLAAVALLLAPRFSRIYLPASVSNDQLIPMGSHPELDHHWGNGQMELVHDGVEYNRFEKIQAIADWPLVAEHLRVCHGEVESGLNCGRCTKCLWTMLVLESVGRLESTPAFSCTLDLAALRQHPPIRKHERDRFTNAIRLLQERDANPELRRVLGELLEEGAKTASVPQSESRIGRRINKLRRKVQRRFGRRRPRA